MTFSLNQLHEKANYPYIYILENHVHLIMPIVGGKEIGIDNTCQSLTEYRKFWGKNHNSNETKDSALHVLKQYQKDLQADILILTSLPDSLIFGESIQQKRLRLQQVQYYIEALTDLKNNPSIPNWQYASSVHELFQEQSNCFTIQFAPQHEDPVSAISTPLFSLQRGSTTEGLGVALRQSFSDISSLQLGKVSDRDLITSLMESTFNEAPTAVNFERFIQCLTQLMQHHFPEQTQTLNLSKSKENISLTWQYLTEDIICDENPSVHQLAGSLLGLALDPGFWNTLPNVNLFYNLANDAEQLSMLTQFFIAQANIQAKISGKSNANFGQCIEQNELSNEVAQTVKTALMNGLSVEAALYELINQYSLHFNLHTPLNKEDLRIISLKCHEQYSTIKDLAEKDEFIIFTHEHAGAFVNHQNKISVPFSTFVRKQFPHKYNSFYEAKEQQLSRQENCQLSHVNTVSAVNVNNLSLDLLSFDLNTEVNYDILASFLSLKDTEGSSLIQHVTTTQSNTLKFSNRRWHSLYEKILHLIDTKDSTLLSTVSEFFGVAQSTEPTLHLTPQMCQNIYMYIDAHYGETRLEGRSNNLTPDKIGTALEIILGHNGFKNITFNGNDGYLIQISLANERKLNLAIQKMQGALHLRPTMARALYMEVTRRFGSDSHQVQEMNSLSNFAAPDKILRALALLNIPIDSSQIAFANYNGYTIRTSSELMQQIQNIHHSFWHTLDQDTIEKLTPNGKQGLRDIFQSQNLDIPVIEGTDTECQIMCSHTEWQKLYQLLSIQENILSLNPVEATTDFYEEISLLPEPALIASQKSVDVQYRTNQNSEIVINKPEIEVLAPSWVEAELQKLAPYLEGARVNLPNGSHYNLTAPLTLKDLQIIARNERANVTGHIETDQYHDIPVEVIYTLKDLVRHCIIAGPTQINQVGGYPHAQSIQSIQSIETQDIILLDLAGLQFQQRHNSGRLVLIGENEPRGALDDVIYQQVVGEPRPTLQQCQLDTTGRFITSDNNQYFDRHAYQCLVANDFILAAEAADRKADPDDEINLKFLKYGSGFFASRYRQIVDDNIYEGVLAGLSNYLQHTPNSKIKCIELPFYVIKDDRIERLCQQYNIEFYAGNIDALAKRKHFKTAVTNCADPHAFAGNEMHHGSVDAMIGENCVLKANEFSPVINPVMSMHTYQFDDMNKRILGTNLMPHQIVAQPVEDDPAVLDVETPNREICERFEQIKIEINRLIRVAAPLDDHSTTAGAAEELRQQLATEIDTEIQRLRSFHEVDPVAAANAMKYHLLDTLNNCRFINTDFGGVSHNVKDYLSHDQSWKQTLLNIVSCILTLGYSLYHGVSNYAEKGYFDNGVSFFKRDHHAHYRQTVLDPVENEIDQISNGL